MKSRSSRWITFHAQGGATRRIGGAVLCRRNKYGNIDDHRRNTRMSITLILAHVPVWVFPLLAALIGLGLLQSRTRQMPIARMLLPSLALAIWSAYSVHQSFPAVPMAMVSWISALILVQPLSGYVFRARSKVDFDPVTRKVTVPGSWVPMALILTIFVMKFWVGFRLALEPKHANDMAFAVSLGAVFGALGGLFLSRSLQVCRHLLRYEGVSSEA